MHVLLIIIGLLLGTAAPASLGAITTLQWITLGLTVAGDVRKLPKEAQQLRAFMESPQFRAWVTANGEGAIRTYPGNVN